MMSVQLLTVDLSELFCVLYPKSDLRVKLMPMDFVLALEGSWGRLAAAMGR